MVVVFAATSDEKWMYETLPPITHIDIANISLPVVVIYSNQAEKY
jgi:hypothetical protein